MRPLRALIATRVGQPLSMADVRESITHLFGLGRFQDVRVDAIEAPGGVLLRYDLIPLHTVSVSIFGPPGMLRPAAGEGLGLDEGLLRRTMTNRFGARRQSGGRRGRAHHRAALSRPRLPARDGAPGGDRGARSRSHAAGI